MTCIESNGTQTLPLQTKKRSSSCKNTRNSFQGKNEGGKKKEKHLKLSILQPDSSIKAWHRAVRRCQFGLKARQCEGEFVMMDLLLVSLFFFFSLHSVAITLLQALSRCYSLMSVVPTWQTFHKCTCLESHALLLLLFLLFFFVCMCVATLTPVPSHTHTHTHTKKRSV